MSGDVGTGQFRHSRIGQSVHDSDRDAGPIQPLRARLVQPQIVLVGLVANCVIAVGGDAHHAQQSDEHC